MVEKAYAKINLALYVGNKRDDGYHEIDTVMVPISLYDTVTITKSAVISVSCAQIYVPNDRRNTAFIAAEQFFQATNIHGGARIKIKKTIPVGGGLGGSSADAAAVLRLLNNSNCNPLTDNELQSIASKIGADVAFMVQNKTAVCRGIGELIQPIETNTQLHFCICFKGEGASTRMMYEQIDLNPRQPKSTDTMRKALENNDFYGICNAVENDFGDICYALRPETARLREQLLDQGAAAAAITGSGACVYGIFASQAAAQAAARVIGQNAYARYAHSL